MLVLQQVLYCQINVIFLFLTIIYIVFSSIVLLFFFLENYCTIILWIYLSLSNSILMQLLSFSCSFIDVNPISLPLYSWKSPIYNLYKIESDHPHWKATYTCNMENNNICCGAVYYHSYKNKKITFLNKSAVSRDFLVFTVGSIRFQFFANCRDICAFVHTPLFKEGECCLGQLADKFVNIISV